MANKPILKIYIDGKMLKKQIADKGYSINSIAKKIGVSDRTIRHYLSINQMPPYIHERIYTIVEDLRNKYSNALKEIVKIESDWKKHIPKEKEIIRYHELVIYAHELEQIIE